MCVFPESPAQALSNGGQCAVRSVNSHIFFCSATASELGRATEVPGEMSEQGQRAQSRKGNHRNTSIERVEVVRAGVEHILSTFASVQVHETCDDHNASDHGGRRNVCRSKRSSSPVLVPNARYL